MVRELLDSKFVIYNGWAYYYYRALGCFHLMPDGPMIAEAMNGASVSDRTVELGGEAVEVIDLKRVGAESWYSCIKQAIGMCYKDDSVQPVTKDKEGTRAWKTEWKINNDTDDHKMPCWAEVSFAGQHIERSGAAQSNQEMCLADWTTALVHQGAGAAHVRSSL